MSSKLTQPWDRIFFERTRVPAKSHLTVDQYVLEFILFACQEHFQNLSRLPGYLEDLFMKPVSWSFPAGARQVPLALSVALAAASVDPSHPLAPTRMRRGVEYDTAVAWFVRWMVPALRHPAYPGWFRSLIDEPSSRIPAAREFGISQLVEGLYWLTEEARENFDLGTSEGRVDLIVWFVRWIAPQLKSYYHPKWLVEALDGLAANYENVRSVLPMVVGRRTHDFSAKPTKSTGSSSLGRRTVTENRVRKPSRAGVNLVGWARAEIGIGEDVRQAVLAFESASVPFCVIDAAAAAPPSSRQLDDAVAAHVVPRRRYAADVTFLDASTQFRYYAVAELRGDELARPIVGVCPWELPSWPADVAFAVKNIDHLWAASRFILEAFAPHFSARRIMLAPPAVVLRGIPHDELVPAEPPSPLRFLTVFDGFSSVHRKNPLAAIRAFRLAFPKNDDVRLTVKFMNVDRHSSAAFDLAKEIGGDERIDLIGRTMLKAELIELVRRHHCFVSLHRAEGFGRNIAEAMLMGRPVVCSEFSGNLDFCTHSNSYLVEGELIPILPGEYFLGDTQRWFDPSVEHASMQMRAVRDDWNKARRIASAGRDHIQRFHSADVVGRKYRDLLVTTIGC